MSKFRITPIGTCRIHNPLRSATGKYPVELHSPRTYGYTHTSREALQQLDFMEGKISFPDHVVKGIFRGGSHPDDFTLDWEWPELVIVEISSMKMMSSGDFALQSRYLNVAFPDFFGSPQRSRTYWALAQQNPDGLAEFLAQDPVFQSLPEPDQRLLASARLSHQTFDELRADMAELTDRIGRGRIIFMTHVNALDQNGRKISAREKLIRWMALAAEELEVDCFDPTGLMLEFGQERAMERDGLDTTHYTPAFYSHLYAHLHRKYIAPLVQRVLGSSAESGAMQAQMLADAIQATFEHDDLVTGSRQLHEALRTNPHSAPLLEMRGVLREKLGDFEGAREDLTSPHLKDIIPANSTREALMRATFALGDAAQTLAVAEALLDDEVESESLYETAALAAEQLNQPEKAQAHWKSLARLDRKNVAAALRVLDGVAAEGPEAESEWIEELVYFAGQDSQLAEALVRHALAKGDAELFAAALDPLASTEPTVAGELLLHPKAKALLLGTSKIMGRIIASDDLPSRLLRDVREIGRGWMAESLQLTEAGRFDAAEVLANHSADALGDDGRNRAQRALAAALMVKARELAAEQQLQAVVDLCLGKTAIVMTRPRLALELARALQGLGRDDEAAEIARESARRFPEDVPIAVTAGRLLRDRDLVAAAALYRAVAPLDVEGKYAAEIEQFWKTLPSRAAKRIAAEVAAGDFESALQLASLIASDEAGAEAAERERAKIHRAMRARVKQLDAEADAAERGALMQMLLDELPGDAAILRQAAIDAMDAKDFAAALGYWERLAKVDPEMESAKRGIVRCRLLIGDAAPAREPETAAA